VVRINKTAAEALGVADGEAVTVGTDRGAVTLPAAITDLPDGVVWLPTNSPGSTLRRSLGVTSGAVVRLSAGQGGPVLDDDRRLSAAESNLAASPKVGKKGTP
jgi:NADH-quinone oxidoreductase subunit G